MEQYSHVLGNCVLCAALHNDPTMYEYMDDTTMKSLDIILTKMKLFKDPPFPVKKHKHEDHIRNTYTFKNYTVCTSN